jgi:hypothetical protein
VGKIIAINDKGQSIIDYPDNSLGPLVARSIVVDLLRDITKSNENVPVLLVFENSDPALPIIVGVIHESVQASFLQEVVHATEQPRQAQIDNKRVVFEAEEEIVLRCGKGSITLRKDGKIILKGTELVSRASRTNKIKGASVAIN